MKPLSIAAKARTWFCLTVGALATSCTAGSATAGYQTKVRFTEGKAIEFPNFVLIYRGKHRVVPPQYSRGWWVHDFTVKTNVGEQNVPWSSGTGDIGPAIFKVGRQSYALELSYSDKLKKLADDELVISKFNEGR